MPICSTRDALTKWRAIVCGNSASREARLAIRHV